MDISIFWQFARLWQPYILEVQQGKGRVQKPPARKVSVSPSSTAVNAGVSIYKIFSSGNWWMQRLHPWCHSHPGGRLLQPVQLHLSPPCLKRGKNTEFVELSFWLVFAVACSAAMSLELRNSYESQSNHQLTEISSQDQWTRKIFFAKLKSETKMWLFYIPFLILLSSKVEEKVRQQRSSSVSHR